MAILTVLAGVNGAGKSSVTGAYLQSRGGSWFDPDAAAADYRAADPELSREEANSRAWLDGKFLLEEAIRTFPDDAEFVFEATLGGNTIAGLLERAAAAGHKVRVVFVGLESVEKHIERVRTRVARGGHDIPEDDIRRRYRTSRLNLVRLLPVLHELVVFDNSEDADPRSGSAPRPRRLLHLKEGAILHIARKLDATCNWARPILAAALQHGAPKTD